MTKYYKTVRIFMMPQQQCACGPESSCCGPTGQSEEEIENLKRAMEKEVGSRIEVLNVTDEKGMKNHLQVDRLVRSFGQMALPIITLNDEVVSMGNSTPERVVSAIREKINQM